MDCLLPEVLAALAGDTPVDVRMVVPPAALRAAPAPRADGKGVLGANMRYHVDGAHFTVQWADTTVDSERAAAILAQLEAAWPVLVDAGGWPAPVSSDTYLLWVVLDPELAGSGYTTVYTTDAYPNGYPVTYLNPDYYADEPEFGLSVAVHEFGHMLQFRLRDWLLGSADGWFWEATSEWIAERGAPALDTYAYSTWWYAQWPDGRFDRLEDNHPYGMVLLVAWLDERVFGLEGVRDTWLAGQDDDRTWDQLIADVAGRDFGELVAGMAAEVAAGTLRESAIYERPLRGATHPEAPGWATIDAPERYGTHFIDIEGGGANLVVEGEVIVAYVHDRVVTDVVPGESYTLVLTGTGEGGKVGYGVGMAPDEVEPEPSGCGCAVAARTGAGGAAWLGMGLALAIARRLPRRPSSM